MFPTRATRFIITSLERFLVAPEAVATVPQQVRARTTRATVGRARMSEQRAVAWGSLRLHQQQRLISARSAQKGVGETTERRSNAT